MLCAYVCAVGVRTSILMYTSAVATLHLMLVMRFVIGTRLSD
jgi:hypothetical protein